MKVHMLTTIFGFIVAISGALGRTSYANTNRAFRDVVEVVQTIATAAFGASAADARKVVTKTNNQ